MDKLSGISETIKQYVQPYIDRGYNALNDAAHSVTKGNINSSTGLAAPEGLSLDEIGKKYHDNLTSGLAGMAVGGGIGAINTDTEDDKTFAAKLKHRLRNALTGSVAGGAVGIGGRTVWDNYLKPKEKEFKSESGVKVTLPQLEEQARIKAESEAAKAPGATPESVKQTGDAAAAATKADATKPRGMASDLTHRALDASEGSTLGRGLSGGAYGAAAGEVGIRLNNAVPIQELKDNLIKEKLKFETQAGLFDKGSPGTPGGVFPARDPALIAPNAKSTVKKYPVPFSPKLTQAERYAELQRLAQTAHPSHPALRRQGVATSTNRGIKGFGIQALLTAAGAGLAMWKGKEAPKTP